MSSAADAATRDDLDVIRRADDLDSLENARYAACAAIRERARKEIAAANAAYRRRRKTLRRELYPSRETIVEVGDGWGGRT